MIEKIRCAFSKAHNGNVAKFNLEYIDGTTVKLEDLDIKEWPYPLKPGKYYYKITKYSTDPISKRHQDIAVGISMTALGLWPKNIKLRRYNGTDLSKVQIPIKWVTDDDYLRAPGHVNVVAYTFMPTPNNPIIPIVFDEKEAWRVRATSFKDPTLDPNYPDALYYALGIVYVLMHEGGHRIGLIHTPANTGSMMDPIVPKWPVPIVDPISVQRIQTIWGTRWLPIRIIKHVQQKRLENYYFKN